MISSTISKSSGRSRLNNDELFRLISFDEVGAMEENN